jgi:uncharacterized membrane protein
MFLSMAPESPTEFNRPPRSRLIATIKVILRTRITTGVLTILPLLVTIWVVRFVFDWLRDASGWAVKAFLLTKQGRPYLESLRFDFSRWQSLIDNGVANPQEHFFDLVPWHVRWGISLFSVLLTIVLLYAIGLFSANIFGRRSIAWLEQFVEQVPGVKTVYRSIKQVLGSLSGEHTKSFQRAAMFPFFHPGVYSFGFVTRTFTDPRTGTEHVCVFCPTTPNPTSGFLFVLKRSEVVELDWSVEDAIKGIMSCGILLPNQMTVPDGLLSREGFTPPVFMQPGMVPPSAAAPGR